MHLCKTLMIGLGILLPSFMWSILCAPHTKKDCFPLRKKTPTGEGVNLISGSVISYKFCVKSCKLYGNEEYKNCKSN